MFVATESVRSLTQSASSESGFNQGFFYKSNDDSSESTVPYTKVSTLSTNPSGLLKVNCIFIYASSQPYFFIAFSPIF